MVKLELLGIAKPAGTYWRERNPFIARALKDWIVNNKKQTDYPIVSTAYDSPLVPAATPTSEVLWIRTVAFLEAHLFEIQYALNTGFNDIKKGQLALYRHVSNAYAKHLEQVFELIQLDRIEKGEMYRTLDSILKVLRAMQSTDALLSTELREVVIQANTAIESSLDVKQKLELTLPIVPVFLEYKIELEAGSNIDLNAVYDEAKDRWHALLARVRK